MSSFIYNDTTFSLTPAGAAWDIHRHPGGLIKAPHPAMVATGLFAGATEAEALARAQALVHRIYPVGIKLVGPDVAHPLKVGDLRIVGPNVGHPNFIHWDQDSASFPR
jgi:hypothetical protein